MKEYMFNGFNINQPKNKRNRDKHDNSKPINWSKIFKLSIVIILVLLVVGFVILYEKDEIARDFLDKYLFRKQISENNLPTIDLSANNSYSFYSHNAKIILLNKNTLTFYNKHGNSEYNLNVEITTPIFESNGDYLCVAEKNGQNIYLILNNNIIWQKTLEGNISNVSINKNGYVSVSLSGTSHKTIVELINPQGNELFKKYLATSYVVDTSISNNNKYLAIAETDLSGVFVQSNIEIISIESAQQNSDNPIVYNYSVPNNSLIIDIEYLNKNILVCKFDNSIGYINNNEFSNVASFDTENIIFSDINNSIIQVVKKRDTLVNSTFELQIITPDNQNIKKYIIDDEPKSIQSYGNIISVNLGSEVLFINNNGWLVKQYESSQEIKDIILCNDIAGIIYANKVEVISL